LDVILTNQKPSGINSGLGYDQKKDKEGFNLSIQKIDKYPKTYVASLHSSFRRENN